MVPRGMCFAQASRIVIWGIIFEMAPFYESDCSLWSKKSAKNQYESMKNGAIYIYEWYCTLHLIGDV